MLALRRKQPRLLSFAKRGHVDFLYNQPELAIYCKCGKEGLKAVGPSVVNYNCHSANTRKHTGDAFTSLSAFKPSQIERIGPIPFAPGTGPQGCSITCSCALRYSIAVDHSKDMGLVCLDISRSKERVEAQYQPNHHFFYPQRVEEALDPLKLDKLPQWETVNDSRLLNAIEPSTVHKVNSNNCSTRLHTSRPTQWDPNSGRLRKDVQPVSATAPAPTVYEYTDIDPPVNHTTEIPLDKLRERVAKKYISSPLSAYVAPAASHYDTIIVGGGHNGLVAAAYLAKAGLKPLVLERRHVVGGAAITEEVVKGFKFSRASYLAGLLRPHIIKDLELEKYGFKYLPRSPSSFTPTRLDSSYEGKHLLLGAGQAEDKRSIAQFSARDAEAFEEYETFLGKIRDIMQPILDNPPMDLSQGKWKERCATLKAMQSLSTECIKHRDVLVPFYELFTGPATQLLDRWFESDILKTTLATDAVVGALISPKMSGSAYVLLHHVMGEAAGKKGVWAYVEGGMGAISNSIAASARRHGAEIVTNATVRSIFLDKGKVGGVIMADGSRITADNVLSGVSPYHTFVELMADPDTSRQIPKDFLKHIRYTDFACAAFKINIAVNKLPNFACYPSPADGRPGPMHCGTVHFESHMHEIDNAYREAVLGIPATRPVIEMTIPSALDSTISPPGQHVVQLFVQYAPYDVDPKVGSWADPRFKENFVHRCLDIVEEFCPGFQSSILGMDALSPLDLEQVFGLHKGNFHHSSLGLHQLAYARPAPGYSSYRSPIPGLYMCSAGTHPGGGVQGAPGHNCAQVVLSDLNKFQLW